MLAYHSTYAGRALGSTRAELSLPSGGHAHQTTSEPGWADVPNADISGGAGVRRGKLRDDQQFWSLLPPARGRATDVHQLADGLWTATQPLLVPGGDAGLRLTAMRMADGSLWASLVVAFACARFDLMDAAAMRGCGWRQ